MKKLFTLISVAFFAMAMSAQNLGTVGVSKSKALAPAKIDASANQVWWGYGDIVNEPQYGLLGTEKAETYDVDMYITGDNPIVAGKQIKAIRVALHDKSVIKDVKVWMSTTQPTSASTANICMYELADGDLVDMGTDGKTIDVALDEPYTVTSAGVYVGYTFTVKSASTQAGKYPIVMSQITDVDNALFIKTPAVGNTWMDAKSYGASATQVLVEGEFEYNKVAVEGFASIDMERNKTDKVMVKASNMGGNAIESLAYTVTFNGTTSEEKTLTTNIRSGLSTSVEVPITSGNEVGEFDVAINFTKVNGVAVDGVVSNGKVNVLAEIRQWPRKVLVEEFTTELCQFCPDAAAGLEAFHKSYPDIASQTATICHHAGYGTDWLTISTATSYEWFYGTGGTYAPAFMWDRYTFPNNSAKVPVESRPSGASGHKTKVDARLAVKSYANIELGAVMNEDNSKMKVNVSCERGKSFGTNPRLFVFITEDNIKARRQSGATGTFIHQHVARACNATWGVALNWNDDKAEYEYTFNIDADWEVDQLKVVAFIANYDSMNRSNCVVEQTQDLVIGNPDGISEASALPTLTEVARYTIDGRQLSSPEPGINIVRLSNGETVKVLVQ